jgi:hypothetical protein
MEYIQRSANPNICLSGGAKGADFEWGRCASIAGHKVIHWTFPTHPSQSPEADTIHLTDAELSIAVPAVRNAAKAINKSPPSRPHIWRLIHRNYYQVAWSESCYAVTVIREGQKVGGTAWATVMFAQLHPESRRLWLFDQEKDGWFNWDGEGWVSIEGKPPRPEGVWAGIGSRDLAENGRRAIRELMGIEESG